MISATAIANLLYNSYLPLSVDHNSGDAFVHAVDIAYL